MKGCIKVSKDSKKKREKWLEEEIGLITKKKKMDEILHRVMKN